MDEPSLAFGINMLVFAVAGLAIAIMFYIDFQKSRDKKKKKD